MADPAAPVVTPAAPEKAAWTQPPAAAPAKAEIVPAAPEAKKEEPKTVTPPVEALTKESIKIPEGKSVEAASLDRLVTFAKDQGLSKAQAQALMDRELSDRDAQTAGYREAMKAQDGKWLDELKAHKDFGGAKFMENSEDAKRAFDFVDQDGSFRKELEAGMLAHHPKLVMAFAKFGKLLKDDRLAVQTTATPSKQPAENRLYPSMSRK